MSLTNTFETRVLTWLLTGDAVTRPSSFYVGLFTTDPGETGAGTEVSGGAYVREAVTLTVSGNTATNSAVLEWPVATADWGNITHVAILDASTSGNVIAYSALTASKTITTGDVLRIPAGDLDVVID